MNIVAIHLTHRLLASNVISVGKSITLNNDRFIRVTDISRDNGTFTIKTDGTALYRIDQQFVLAVEYEADR